MFESSAISSRTAFALAIVAVVGTLAAAACSSSSTGGGSSGGGADAAPDDDGGLIDPEGGANADCFQACTDQHPGAPAKLQAVDDCVGAHCSMPCEGDLVDAGPDAGLCGTTFPSGAPKACDDCIGASCCAAWSGCFGDPDCLAYNDCLSACPQE